MALTASSGKIPFDIGKPYAAGPVLAALLISLFTTAVPAWDDTGNNHSTYRNSRYFQLQ